MLQTLGCGRERNLVVFPAGLIRLDGLLVDPLDPALPNTSHGIPLIVLGPVNVSNTRPRILGIGGVEMKLRPHNFNPVLVQPDGVFSGQRPLNGVYGALARV